MGLREKLSEVLYLLVLFFLAAGRIEIAWGDLFHLKIGENIENLLGVLLVARFLQGQLSGNRLRQLIQPVLSGLCLILPGLMVTLLLHPSLGTLEDILRLMGQILIGLLLAERLILNPRSKDFWFWTFVAGVAILMIRTPWSHLDNPNLEGPFPHRNIQAAFCLLAVPLVASPLFRNPLRWNSQKIVSLLVLGVLVAFLLFSHSRSGMLALVVATGVGFLLLGRTLWRSGFRQRWAVSGGTVLALGIVMFSLIPRFQHFGQEVFDPYRRSRIPIWAAAVEGWSNPTVLLFGIGMDDTFDRILLDTPQGNLNYRYRKAHYPHGLYFQWLYWGGITALLGWLVLVVAVGGRLFSSPLEPVQLLAGLFLVAYFFLEIFESAFRDPRVAAMYWLVVFLFFASGRGEEARNG